MKRAIIYFEGKEVSRFVFDTICDFNGVSCFFLKEEEVANFPKTYGYVITSSDIPNFVLFKEHKKNAKVKIKDK